MLGAFDGEKIALFLTMTFTESFYINDFNWNVTNLNHTTKEFKLIRKSKTVIITKHYFLTFD